ncbi:unnamed protein product [Musa acuminata subsp. burmannicoides]
MKAEEGERGGKKAERGLKKGPWTPAEDAILVEHVRRHGEGNWNAVQRHSGLARCGKSCRLRWANHLRPNLKKGSFTPDEELLILRLHAQLGNKWARMAAQLPGRTDNEIKNYWNTRLKRRQRAGLPIYPPELQEAVGFDHQLKQQASTLLRTPPPLPPPPSAAEFNARLPSLRPAPLLDPAIFRPSSGMTLPPLPQNLFSCHLGFGFPLSPASPPPTPTSLFQQQQQLGPGNYEVSRPQRLPPVPWPTMAKMELPSCQLFPEPVGGRDGLTSSGLLEALLQDAHVPEDMKLGELLALPTVGEQEAVWEHVFFGGDSSEAIKETSQGCSLGSATKLEGLDCDMALLAGSKNKSDPRSDANTEQDDISALLDIPAPPVSMIPEWCNTDSTESPAMVDNETGLDIHQLASPVSIASSDHDWNISSWPWNNMPGIC